MLLALIYDDNYILLLLDKTGYDSVSTFTLLSRPIFSKLQTASKEIICTAYSNFTNSFAKFVVIDSTPPILGYLPSNINIL